MGNGRRAKMNFNHDSNLELVLYSRGIMNFTSMKGWLHWWPSEWPLWIILLHGDSTTPPIKRLGLFLHCLNLSCLVICFGQKKKEKQAEVTLYPDLKRSICFHCFLETCPSMKTSPAHPAEEWDQWLHAPHPTPPSAIADQQAYQWSHPRPASSQLTS